MSLRLGSYTLLDRIAVGGMAEIWLAHRDGLRGPERVCVIKRMLPQLAGNPEAVEMFVGEARLLAKLDHPGFVRVFGFEAEATGGLDLALEYVPGENLAEVLQAFGNPLPLALAAALLAEVAGALGHAHERGIVHCDVNPANVMISLAGEVKVLDLGIAAARGRNGTIRGTYAYLAPEQARGMPFDHRADLFALGAIGHELVTGRRLFHRANPMATLHAVTEERIPRVRELVPAIPPELDDILARALAVDPDDRHADAAELATELAAFAAMNGYADPARVRRHLARLVEQVLGDKVAAERRRFGSGEEAPRAEAAPPRRPRAPGPAPAFGEAIVARRRGGLIWVVLAALAVAAVCVALALA